MIGSAAAAQIPTARRKKAAGGWRRPYTRGVESWPALIELYEYKVADVLSGRDPRGGRRSVIELRDALLGASLDSTLLRRFMTADRQWRHHTRFHRPTDEVRGAALFGDILPVTTPEAPDGEADCLRALSQALWRVQADEALRDVAREWAREPGLATLRVLYALSLNLEAGGLKHPVPDEHDTLVSLGNPQVAHPMLTGLLDLLMAQQGETVTAVGRARTLALEITSNPQLSHSGAEPRARLRDAFARGLAFLEDLLPTALGGRGEPPVAVTQVLHGQHPDRALDRPGNGAVLAVRLRGAEQVEWRGETLAWQPGASGWQLTAHGAVYPLRDVGGGVSVTRVPLEGVELRASQIGEYLLMQFVEGRHASLFALLALARPMAALLDPSHDHLNLRLARAVAQRLRDGRIDTTALGPDSAGRYRSADAAALLAFARKGAENLVARLRRLPRVDASRAFQDAARALGCSEARALNLLEAVYVAVFAAPPPEQVQHVRTARQYALVAYRGEPVGVEVLDRTLTLRTDYKGDVAAVLPGAPAAVVHDVAAFILPQGGILVARQGMRIAVGYQEAAPV